MEPTKPKTLTEYVMVLLPQPQVAAATARAVLNGLIGAVGAFLTLYLWDVPTDDAIKAAIAAGIIPLFARGGMEGAYDYMRAKSNNIKPWDVGAYSEPIDKGKAEAEEGV